MNVLVTYCCIISYPKLSGKKMTILLCSKLCKSGIGTQQSSGGFFGVSAENTWLACCDLKTRVGVTWSLCLYVWCRVKHEWHMGSAGIVNQSTSGRHLLWLGHVTTWCQGCFSEEVSKVTSGTSDRWSFQEKRV